MSVQFWQEKLDEELVHHKGHPSQDIEDFTRWGEDMNFMFEWQELYLTSERSERVKILFLSRERKIHIFELTCNVLFII